MGTGYTRNDTSNNIADGNIINAADLDGEFDAIESALGTSGHTHDGTSAEGGPVTVLGPVQDFVASATEIKPKTTNTLSIGTSSLLFKDMFLDGVATIGSIKIDNAGTIGTTTTGDAITISSSGIVTFKDDIIVKDGGTIGVTSAVDAMTVSSAGIVTFKDDIIIKDGGTIGSASDADAIAISSGGVVTFSQAVSNLGNVTGKTSSGFVLALQTSDISIEATNVLGKIEFSAPDEDSGTDAILVGASIEALAEDTFSSSVNSTALVFKTNTTGAATERMRLTSAGDLHFLDNRKAIFGAGSDLKIYHDGSGSYVEDTGTGNLKLKTNGAGVEILNSADLQLAFFNNSSGEAVLKHINSGVSSTRLNTTSTGVDITGTLTSDGLTVDGDGTFSATNPTVDIKATNGNDASLILMETTGNDFGANGANGFRSRYDGGDNAFYIQSGAETTIRNRIKVDRDTGDISFYEDQGSAVKFFWDASEERLGIGTTSPDSNLHIEGSGSTNSEQLLSLVNAGGNTGAGSQLWLSGTNATTRGAYIEGQAQGTDNRHDLIFATGGSGSSPSERMRIDSTGSVGIGTSSPNRSLTIEDGDVQIHETGTVNDPILNFSVGNTQASPTQSWSMRIDNSDGDKFQLMDVTDSRIVLTADGSGNVGIGTDSPARTLHVTRGDGTGTVAKIGNTGTSSAIIEFSDTSTTDTVSIGSVGNDLTLKSDDGDISLNTTGDPATASLYVERGGNVGIGTTAPSTLLQLEAQNSGSATNNALRFRDTDTAVQSGQSIGLIEFATADSSNAGVNARFNVIYAGTGGGSEMFFQTGLAGSLENRFYIEDGSTIFNESGGDRDFRVESDTKTHAIFLNASTNVIHFGGSTQLASTNFINCGGVTFSNGSADGGKFLSWDNEGGTGAQKLIGYWYDGSSYRARFVLPGDTSEFAFNDSSEDLDFRVESDTNANVIFLNGGENRLGLFGNETTAATNYANGICTKTGLGCYSVSVSNISAGATSADIDIPFSRIGDGIAEFAFHAHGNGGTTNFGIVAHFYVQENPDRHTRVDVSSQSFTMASSNSGSNIRITLTNGGSFTSEGGKLLIRKMV